MAQLLKLIKILSWILSISLCSIIVGCKGQNVSEWVDSDSISFSQGVQKTGYIIYDNKKVRAYFIENKIVDLSNISRSDISSLISNSDGIILLRSALQKNNNASIISLSLCTKSPDFLITQNNLMFNRYHFIKIKNFLLYPSEKKYDDLKVRYSLCNYDN